MLKIKNRRVAHLVRKLLPPFSSFIRNQIMSHIRYRAYVIYKEYVNSDFSNEIISSHPSFYCEGDKRSFRNKKYSKLLYSKPFRRLTVGDKRNIISFLLENRIDILHLHYGTDAVVFIDIVKNLNIPSVVSFYGYDCSSFPHWYFGYSKRCLQKVFKYTDYCLAMSKDMKFDLLNIGCPKNKIIIHYHGSDVLKFYYNRKYKQKETVTFLIVASLIPQKGHIFLLRAFKEALGMTNKMLNLRIVGDGYLYFKLKKYVIENNLGDYIYFLGSLKHMSQEILQEFYKADIFIHPSVTSKTKEKEGIPGSIVEAMATGLPVISTYHAGIPSIIYHKQNGYLIDECDINKLSEYICELAEDVILRKEIGQRAQQYVIEKLDLKQKEIELENIYDFAIKNSNK